MSDSRWGAGARWVLVGLVVLMASMRGYAATNNFENGGILFNGTTPYDCVSCHDPLVGNIPDPSTATAADILGQINNPAEPMGTNPTHTALLPLTTGTTSATNQLSDLIAYLHHPVFPTANVTSTTVNLATAVAKLTTSSVPYQITNNGTQSLTGLTAALVDNTNFAVSVPGACTPLAAGTSCSITITFKPQSVANFSTTLTLTTPGTFAGSIPVMLNGTSVAPLVLAGAANVSFNSGDAAKPLRVVANLAGSVQVCLAGETAFPAAAGDYAVTGITLDGTGCGTVASAGGNIDLGVTFLAAAGSGPKNAALTYLRVGGAADTAVVYHLQGNVGPVINFSDTDPFNQGASDQTEVDGNVITTRTISISNGGNADLHVTSFAITSVDPAHPEVAAEYALGGSGCQPSATLVQGGAPCALTLNFNPTALGLQAARLTIVSDAKNLPQPSVIALNGVGKHGPRLAVAEGAQALATNATVDFTSQRPGQTYAAQILTLSNGGTLGDLELSLPAQGAVAGFSVVPGAGCAATLAPAATCSLAISFVPTLVQHYGGSLQLQSRPAGSAAVFDTFVVNLSGDGTNQAPALSWRDPNSLTTVLAGLSFAATQAGNAVQQQVALYNSGPGTASLKFTNVVGTDAGNYTLDASACLATSMLGQNSSCVIVVRFSPLAAGAKAASLQVVSDGNGPTALSLSGSGIASASAGALSLSPATLTFDTTTVGASSAPLAVTLTNSGAQALSVQALAATGPYSVQTQSCPAPPFSLMPGAACTVAVSFVPNGSSTTSGTLQVTSDASSTSAQAALSGNSQSAASVSSGGCAIGGDPRTDPTLWALVLLAAGVLWQRRRARWRQAQGRNSRGDEIER